ncbi:hypothetical protein, partial [Acrocarpospora catenulata]|uniref:hypothetical protein n=1 Tax=Acrocarpospora catenulata TaxID=2836182 RepID=UPI001BDA27CD
DIPAHRHPSTSAERLQNGAVKSPSDNHGLNKNARHYKDHQQHPKFEPEPGTHEQNHRRFWRSHGT